MCNLDLLRAKVEQIRLTKNTEKLKTYITVLYTSLDKTQKQIILLTVIDKRKHAKYNRTALRK